MFVHIGPRGGVGSFGRGRGKQRLSSGYKLNPLGAGLFQDFVHISFCDCCRELDIALISVLFMVYDNLYNNQKNFEKFHWSIALIYKRTDAQN